MTPGYCFSIGASGMGQGREKESVESGERGNERHIRQRTGPSQKPGTLYRYRFEHPTPVMGLNQSINWTRGSPLPHRFF